MSKALYADVDGVNSNELINVSIDTNHDSAIAIANIACINHSLDIGDEIEIDLGFTDSHSKVFTGYVKQIDRKVPDNSYTITAHDVMTRAIDFFVASSNPESPFKRRNISAEDLVQDVLELSGLNSFNMQPTSFTLAIGTDAEVNLISAYDYCNSIADIVAWHLYADIDGVVNFVNR
jgi:hypothetical protein